MESTDSDRQGFDASFGVVVATDDIDDPDRGQTDRDRHLAGLWRT